MYIWVVGAGGLFGSALVRQARESGHAVRTSTDVPWGDPIAARAHLAAEADSFLQSVKNHSDSWGIAWAAGRVTTASSQHDADLELALFRDFVGDLAALAQRTDLPIPGAFLLASSAGGAYAGSAPAPFHSSTIARPLGLYGELKIAQEHLAITALGGSFAVTIARLANLYGPGQDLAKLQGLVSRLALSSITREPLTMFVPTDTLRDYIYVDDAAACAMHWMDTPHSGAHVRVIATGEATSLGHLIAMVQSISHVRFPVAYGLHPSAAAQARDIRLIPDSDPVIASMPRTSLPEGIKRVYLDILQRLQAGTTAAV